MARDRLTVEEGETRTIEEFQSKEHFGADIDGTLEVQGELELVDDPDIEGPQPGASPISIPLDIDFRNMQIGNAIFLSLTMGLLLGAVAFLKNYAAGVMLMLALFALVVSGMLGLGLEIFWSMIAATALLLIVGMVFRWST